MGKLHDAAPEIYDERDRIRPEFVRPGPDAVPAGRFIFRRGTKLRLLLDDYTATFASGGEVARATILGFLDWLDTQP